MTFRAPWTQNTYLSITIFNVVAWEILLCFTLSLWVLKVECNPKTILSKENFGAWFHIPSSLNCLMRYCCTASGINGNHNLVVDFFGGQKFVINLEGLHFTLSVAWCRNFEISFMKPCVWRKRLRWWNIHGMIVFGSYLNVHLSTMFSYLVLFLTLSQANIEESIVANLRF